MKDNQQGARVGNKSFEIMTHKFETCEWRRERQRGFLSETTVHLRMSQEALSSRLPREESHEVEWPGFRKPCHSHSLVRII